MYKVMFAYDDAPVFETDDLKQVIKYIKDKEQKEYSKYLKYYQGCIDNYEDPTIDEKPADYYIDYFVVVDNELYDITNINLLKNKLKGSDNK